MNIIKFLIFFLTTVISFYLLSDSFTHNESENKKICEKELLKQKSPAKSVYVGYIKDNNREIVPAFYFKDGKFISTEIFAPDVKKLFEVETGESVDTIVHSGFTAMANDRCISSAKTTSDKKFKQFTLFTSKKIALRKPTPEEINFFYTANKRCVIMGDYLEPKKCTKPEILFMSDLDNNGLFEYWIKYPYMWEFGLSIHEQSKDKKGLKVIVDTCYNCD